MEMKRRLRAGENIRFTVKYDFDLAKAHYPTVLSGISYFEITVSVVLDENKEIDKFLFIAQDVTEAVHTQEILRQSKQKTALAMQALSKTIRNRFIRRIGKKRRLSYWICSVVAIVCMK